MALRLIALFKIAKGLLLVVIGVSVLRLVHADVAAVAAEWAQHLNVHPHHRHLEALLTRLSSVDRHTLATLGVGSFAYAAVLLTEGIGLWLQRRWAEYATVVVTASFVPLELHETSRHVTVTRLVVIGLNVAIVWYLVTRLRIERRGDRAHR